MVAGGIAYALAQCGLASAAGLWDAVGGLTVIILALFLLQGAVMVFAGLEKA